MYEGGSECEDLEAFQEDARKKVYASHHPSSPWFDDIVFLGCLVLYQEQSDGASNWGELGRPEPSFYISFDVSQDAYLDLFV